MNQEIEKLIDLALADGEITDKERSVILKKSEKLGEDPDEVEMILDGRLHESKKLKTKEKVGNIKVCPSCGESVKSFQINCSSCGHEFNIDSNIIKIIQEKFNEIEISVNKKEVPLVDRIDVEGFYQRQINKYQSRFIDNLEIPKSKGEILNLFSLSITQSNKTSTNNDNDLRNAWKLKSQQLKNIIEIQLKNDSDAKQLIDFFNKSQKVYFSKKLKYTLMWVTGSIFFIFFITLMVINENREKRDLIDKLEKIENQILDLVKEGKYDRALILTDQIIWTHKGKELRKQYSDKKKSLEDKINNLKKGN